jgi:transcriptional regulator with XRE-family HTH domain
MNKPSRRSRGTVTIEDVARAAGVSAMTVSRVINKEQNVREETRERSPRDDRRAQIFAEQRRPQPRRRRSDAYRPALFESERRLSQPVPGRRADAARQVRVATW